MRFHQLKQRWTRSTRGVGGFVLVLLAIELLDELVFGAREAAWPLLRADLGLSYQQIGLLLGVPTIVANLIEPGLGILGDVWRRRVVVVGGGLVFTVALALLAAAPGFAALLLAFLLLYPASGAFVALSQASLMDLDPARHEQNMARWTLAGSVGVLLGPLALGAAVLLGAGWRGVFAVFAVLALALVLVAWRQPYADAPGEGEEVNLRSAAREALRALRRGPVVRWLTLLAAADLVGDVLLGFLALYLVDVVRASPAQAALAVTVWTGVGLAGDLLLIPVLERVRGLRFVRWGALAMLLLFPAFLLVPSWAGKLVLLGLVGLANVGWYPILQAQLYGALPGRSGTAMAVNSAFGTVEGFVPIALGLVAQRFGLDAMMWLLLLGPVALLVGLPRGTKEEG